MPIRNIDNGQRSRRRGSTVKKHKSRTRSFQTEQLAALYRTPLRASRSGSLYAAFPYPTKISPEAIAVFIATHTKPGDTVFDAFAGSGTTGLATILCAKPTPWMKAEAKRLHLQVKWGARKAVLNELGVLGSFIADTLCNPPDPAVFAKEAEALLADCERDFGWMYEARDPRGETGRIRHVVWSDVVECPNCGKSSTLWEGSVRRTPAQISSKFSCPHCARKSELSDGNRVTTTGFDDLLVAQPIGRLRKPVWVYGATGSRQWSRAIDATDRTRIRRIMDTALPKGIPVAEVPWGDLYRSGYHQGITHLHHFYTRRNLIAFAGMWNRTESSPLRDALRFWLLSYNGSHATLMARVVAKEGQDDLVVTSAQPGVLYVSGLPVEKNLFAGLRRKLKTIREAFTTTRNSSSKVTVRQGSIIGTGLETGSIDYVFTDPPFGGNIPYAEINFVNEAWLGRRTDAQGEVTISKVQGKNAEDYQFLMTKAFVEMNRLLKRTGKATVVFHSASAQVWNALSRAYADAGLKVDLASVLDKLQGSFKQITTSGAVKGDPLLLLSKGKTTSRSSKTTVSALTKSLVRHAHSLNDPAERTPQRLYSRFVNHYLVREQPVPLDAGEFYRLVANKSLQTDANQPAR